MNIKHMIAAACLCTAATPIAAHATGVYPEPGVYANYYKPCSTPGAFINHQVCQYYNTKPGVQGPLVVWTEHYNGGWLLNAECLAWLKNVAFPAVSIYSGWCDDTNP